MAERRRSVTANVRISPNIIAVFIFTLSGCDNASVGPVGHYRSVSESEWTIDLYLESDGSALVVHQAWLPGREDLTTDEYSGSWSIAGTEITLSYDGNVDTLRYSEDRSFREFGCPGDGPGVEVVGDVTGFRLSLWTVESLSAIPDPCILRE